MIGIVANRSGQFESNIKSIGICYDVDDDDDGTNNKEHLREDV